jgi:hypothetical protein
MSEGENSPMGLKTPHPRPLSIWRGEKDREYD